MAQGVSEALGTRGWECGDMRRGLAAVWSPCCQSHLWGSWFGGALCPAHLSSRDWAETKQTRAQ